MADFKESFNHNRSIQFDPLDFTILVNSPLYPEYQKNGIYWVRTKSRREQNNQITKEEQFSFNEEKKLHGTHWCWDEEGKVKQVVAIYENGNLVKS